MNRRRKKIVNMHSLNLITTADKSGVVRVLLGPIYYLVCAEEDAAAVAG